MTGDHCTPTISNGEMVEREEDGDATDHGWSLRYIRMLFYGFIGIVVLVLLTVPMHQLCSWDLLRMFTAVDTMCFTHEAKRLGMIGAHWLARNRTDRAKPVWRRMEEQGMVLSVDQRPRYGIPHLKSRPFWEVDQLSEGQQNSVKILEKNWKAIWAEAKPVLSKGLNSNAGILERNDNHEGLVAAGEWSILRLYLRGQRNGTVCKQVPKLCAVMDEVVKETPLCRLGQVKFSMLPPGTKVLPHCGPSNMRLRLHLGLKVPNKQFRIRAGNETRTWKQGKVLLIEDSFEHEVLTPAAPAKATKLTIDDVRTVLIVDVWHKDVTHLEMAVQYTQEPIRWK
mmetsp:Transcript_72747/g.207203  ORF Transcript_72747/g.207203 Transcript_72747/m.207203 type:complete len:338 (-) Transcript_72747:76-1089(-)